MTGFVIVCGVVVALLAGSLMALRHYRLGLPSQDVIDRARQREREITAREQAEDQRP